MTKDISPTSRPSLPLAARGALAVLAAAALTTGPAARGASIQGIRSAGIHIRGEEVRELRQFLAGGPARWATDHHPPKLPRGLVLADAQGELRNTPVVKYLLWDRSQNPTRFDLRHPKIAPLFQRFDAEVKQLEAQILASRTKATAPASAGLSSRSAAFQVLTGPKDGAGHATRPGGDAVRPAAQGIEPVPVPEPSSVASLLLAFAAAGGWWRSRTRAHHRVRPA